MKVLKLLPFTILWISIYTVLPYPKGSFNAFSFLNNNLIAWVLGIGIVVLFSIFQKFWVSKFQTNIMIWILLYLIWNCIQIVHGFFVAENYWDWKGLIQNAIVLGLPVVALSSTQVKLTQMVLHTYMRFALPFAVVIFFVCSPGGFGFYLAPIAYLLFFLPIVTKRWKVALLGIAGIILFIDLDARSNIIKFSVPLVLLGFSFLWDFRKVFLLEWVRKVFFVIPILLFVLGVTGVFNVFKLDEYIQGNYVQEKRNEKGDLVAINLKADTRTGLYQEVIQTANKYNSWVFGRSPARGNETELFANLAEITGKRERLGNEAAILNIFTWTGVVGVLLYFMVFYKASYLAINQSKNTYAKLVGLFIAFRWIYAWVEDINNFSLNYFMLWLFIGLCFSNEFRGMTNQEVRWWVRGIFDKKYRYMEQTNRAEVLI